MRGLLDPRCPPATVAGLDLIRDESGELLVLEDNLRMPSGAAYAIAVREAVDAGDRAGRAASRARWRASPSAAARRSVAAAPAGRDEPVARSSPTGPRTAPGTSIERLGRRAGAAGRHPGPARDRRWPALRPPRPASGPDRRRSTGASTRTGLRARTGRPTALGELLLPALRVGQAAAASTPSAPASATTSSPTPTSSGWSSSTSARSRCCARCRATTSPTRPTARRRWNGSRSW